MKTVPTHRTVNWIPLPDPIREEGVNIQLLDWTTDARTTAALERQAAPMGFESPAAYLHQLIVSDVGWQRRGCVHRSGRPACEWMRYRSRRIAAKRLA